MPYIKADDGRREALRNFDIAQSAGELNYQTFYYIKYFYPKDTSKTWFSELVSVEHVITNFVTLFLGDNPNYQKYNDMTGALVRCYKEVERRLNIKATVLSTILESYDDEIAVYEDKKIIENTDVE